MYNEVRIFVLFYDEKEEPEGFTLVLKLKNVYLISILIPLVWENSDVSIVKILVNYNFANSPFILFDD
ncbi:hypothetical protein AMI01nite_55430 [Aneurinibacillus migulanus]|nr:hypothetical protein AMI01nite_55430 [Aneurinibacillus migulanus]